MIEGISNCRYWTDADYRRVHEAVSFKEIGQIAVEVYRKMPRPVSQYCAPISTGGLGCPKKNLRLFRGCVEKLRAEGENPFDQVPLQIGFDRLVQEWKMLHEGYCWPIIDETYYHIFTVGRPDKTFFAFNWHSSLGTSRERQIVMGLGIPIKPFPKEWYEEIRRNLELQIQREEQEPPALAS